MFLDYVTISFFELTLYLY